MTALPDAEKRGPVHLGVTRFFEARRWLGDALFKVLPLSLLALNTWGLRRPGTGLMGADIFWPLMLLLEMSVILLLALSRIRPGLAAGSAAVACTLQILTLQGPGWSSLAVPVFIYSAAKYGSRRASIVILGWGLLGALLAAAYMALVFLIEWHRRDPTQVGSPVLSQDLPRLLTYALLLAGFCAAVVVAAWTLGDLGGRRRREQAAISEKNRLLEVERDQEARLAADAERMRIAREMHDVVSHSMSVMIAQSDGGRYVVHAHPNQAEEAFEAIGRTGRDALSELRRMLGVLREDSEELARRPAPSLEQLPQLIEDVRASGLEAQLAEAPSSGPALTEGAGLAVYRIIQEALTNTLKHGGEQAAAAVRITVEGGAEADRPGHDDAELVVEVRDTGQSSAAPSDGAGSGILGMTERARLYGGEVEAQPEPGGFRLTARFPLSRVAAAAQPDAEGGSP
ncbi:sensor histidine kinase [Nesterenkonia populi]|uniref:sensor histidine kinase n=1 Tax=Nesterenkonia populi TaxID=1591087 RepID=UPI0011BD97F5|nr:histidine kinase [Nesterenkonia populi]